ncbi:MAG: hypothetical protein JWN15_1191 [Firmicutes bacterium]|nr:hypothetical protein [Bacillota bacterium]
MAAAGGAGAGGAAAGMMQAVKASGILVTVEPNDFLWIVQQSEAPLVVRAPGGWFQKTYQYLTAYKGLAFYTLTDSELALPEGSQLIAARKLWMPG